MTLRDALQRCKRSPPTRWPAAAYSLVGRDDLASAAVEGGDWDGDGARGRASAPVAGVGGREDARGTRGFSRRRRRRGARRRRRRRGRRKGGTARRTRTGRDGPPRSVRRPLALRARPQVARGSRASRERSPDAHIARVGRRRGRRRPAAVRAATATRRLSPRNRRGCGRSRPGRPRSPSDEARSPSERAARGPRNRCGCRRSPSPAASPRRGARR